MAIYCRPFNEPMPILTQSYGMGPPCAHPVSTVSPPSLTRDAYLASASRIVGLKPGTNATCKSRTELASHRLPTIFAIYLVSTRLPKAYTMRRRLCLSAETIRDRHRPSPEKTQLIFGAGKRPGAQPSPLTTYRYITKHQHEFSRALG